ncbi:MAG: PaaI family thioesterase [Candidatus Promineifilaceae bacterium]|nr:PaaI family thioesterase [Candidatus Promineifilaceae bacterium]
MSAEAFQDHYDDTVAHCYGCGRLNEQGLQIKSYWEGSEAVCRYTPRPYHHAIPGYVYGGLIASLIDCHSTGTAAAAAAEESGEPLSDVRYVTASLHVDYVKPTPLGPELEVRASVREIKGRKVVVESTLHAGGEVTAKGEALLVRMPDSWVKEADAD